MAKTGIINKVKRALCLAHTDTVAGHPAGPTCTEAAFPGFIAHASAKQAAVFVGLHEEEEEALRSAPSIASTLAEQQQLAGALAHFTSRSSRSRSVDAAHKLGAAAAAARASLESPAHLPPLNQAAKKAQDFSFAPLSSQQFDWATFSDQAPKAAAPPSPLSLFYSSTAFTTSSAASATAAYSQLSGVTGLSTANSASNLNFCAAAMLNQAFSSTAEQQPCGPGPACADWSVSMGYGCNRTRTSARSAQPYTWAPSGDAAASPERTAHAPTSRLFKQSSTHWVMAV